MPISFTLIATLMLVAMIYVIKDDWQLMKVVRAGDVQKNVPVVKVVDSVKKEYIEVGQDRIDIQNFKALFVRGNSMREYQIIDGQIVYVERFTNDAQKQGINTFPVLVLKLQKRNIFLRLFVSQLKLRKFICYIKDLENVNWGEVFNAEHNRIKLEREEFICVINHKIEEMMERGEYLTDCQYVLSETYDEDTNRCSYSLHQVSKIYGKVRYAA